MYGGIIVIADRSMNLVLGGLLALAMVIIVGLCIHNWQLNHSLVEADKQLQQKDADIAIMKTATAIQNRAIDDLETKSMEAKQASDHALAELKPFVEEQERRILGIRSAQYSSVSNNASERLENIRQKMLQDALL